MKTCPMCGAKAVDMASTCFECLYSFIDHTAGDAPLNLPAERDLADTPNVSSKSEPPETSASSTESAPVDAHGLVSVAAAADASKEPAPSRLTPQDVSDIFVELWKRGTLEKRYLSHNGSLYVGSAPYNDVKISSGRVAKRALHIYRLGDTVFAEVLSDSTQVFLNGQELDGVVPLRASDTLSFGDIRLVLA